MSYADGMAAIHLEMPARVPRTEYSATTHWDLVRAVTGIDVNSSSEGDVRRRASLAFEKAWSFDFLWNVCILSDEFGAYRTDMGHAAYNADGSDFREGSKGPFQDEDDVLAFDAMEKLEQKPMGDIIDKFNANYRNIRNGHPDLVNMTGVYVTCMSGLIDLFGWDLLLTAAGINAAGFGRVTDQYAKWIGRYFEALAQSEAEVVMVHDDIVWTSGAFLPPEWYRKYIFPNYKKLLRPLLDSGKKIMYTCDGDFTQFIDDIVDSGVHGLVMEPTTDMAYIAEKYGKTHAFVGNADTRILQYGTRDEIEAEVKRCMDIGKKCPGFFMAVGNHIPDSTPVENALWYNECYERMSKRR